ncbi:hypothetical protein B7P43_G13379 [Cryptotermes secundus]|uniref:Uncharacterized protein n=1 Tax=Cryptotermes secundus TaxID=105785 RepID=A0A2J7QSZ1_9NEOP|nr:hypothetical protein B7P43_G13379 [Cryptotermes secundus]
MKEMEEKEKYKKETMMGTRKNKNMTTNEKTTKKKSAMMTRKKHLGRGIRR